MMHLTPQKIAEITNGKYIGDDNLRNARVIGAVRDNRDVQQGNLFVCIRGERVDGHLYANSAFASGAA
jgi:UDP-N-acetylmuramoyl-tripeptide--D-alanyl-D-alanine ligase